MVLSVHNFLFFSDFNAQQNTSLTMRIIGSVLRRNGEQSVYNSMVEVVQLQRQFPDFVVGFDLVDEEDRFCSLKLRKDTNIPLTTRYHKLIFYIEDFFKIQQYIAENNYPRECIILIPSPLIFRSYYLLSV